MIADDQGLDASAEVDSRFNDVHERIDELAAGMQRGFEEIRTLLANLTMQIVDSRNVSGSTIQMVGSDPQPLPAQLSGGGPSAPTPTAAPSAPSTPTPVRASTSAATVAYDHSEYAEYTPQPGHRARDPVQDFFSFMDPIQGPEGSQPTENGRFRTRFVKLTPSLAISAFSADKAGLTAYVVAASKYSFDPSMVLTRGQSYDNASFFSHSAATHLTTDPRTRLLIVGRGGGHAVSLQLQILQEVPLGTLFAASEILNAQTNPTQFHDNTVMMLKTYPIFAALVPSTPIERIMQDLPTFDKVIENFRIFGVILVCLEQQLLGHMSQQLKAGSITQQEYDTYRSEVATPTHQERGAIGPKGFAKIDVITEAFFHHLPALKWDIQRDLASSLKDARGNRREASVQQIMDLVIARLLNRRVPVEALFNLTRQVTERETLKDYHKSLEVAKVPSVVRKPADTKALVYAAADHTEEEPSYDGSGLAGWSPTHDVWTAQQMAVQRGIFKTQRDALYLAQSKETGVCYANTRGDCENPNCPYSHEPAAILQDGLKAGERFLSHEALQTPAGAKDMLQSIAADQAAGALDPARRKILSRVGRGLNNFGSGSLPSPANPRPERNYVEPGPRIVQRAATPPPAGGPHRDRDRERERNGGGGGGDSRGGSRSGSPAPAAGSGNSRS